MDGRMCVNGQGLDAWIRIDRRETVRHREKREMSSFPAFPGDLLLLPLFSSLRRLSSFSFSSLFTVEQSLRGSVRREANAQLHQTHVSHSLQLSLF